MIKMAVLSSFSFCLLLYFLSSAGSSLGSSGGHKPVETPRNVPSNSREETDPATEEGEESNITIATNNTELNERMDG